ncbi:hypothetical protein RYH80_18045 [Halobaculum sp. MBLA0147]|uniref:hypothetical protein n=1 Tax=Halobaculum sp. MBLA0147 TaxID=3079934 RepID=UPI003524BE1F
MSQATNREQQRHQLDAKKLPENGPRDVPYLVVARSETVSADVSVEWDTTQGWVVNIDPVGDTDTKSVLVDEEAAKQIAEAAAPASTNGESFSTGDEARVALQLEWTRFTPEHAETDGWRYRIRTSPSRSGSFRTVSAETEAARQAARVLPFVWNYELSFESSEAEAE